MSTTLRFGYIDEVDENVKNYINNEISNIPVVTPTLAQVLTTGNETGGSNIVVTDNKNIVFEEGIQITLNNEVPATPASGTSIALGSGTTDASGINSIAIGNGASASHVSSMAIGASASATQDFQIAIGNSSNHTVIPGELVTGKWNGGIGFSNISQYSPVSGSVNLSFSGAIYSNDVSGLNPVLVGSSGQVRLYGLNSVYLVSCRMKIAALTDEGRYTVAILHTRMEMGIPIIMNTVGHSSFYKGDPWYINVSGMVFTSSDPTQFVTVLVENTTNAPELEITEYQLSAFRLN